MILFVSDRESISGVDSPLFARIEVCLRSTPCGSDGVYLQKCGSERTALLGANGGHYTVIASEEADFCELESFLRMNDARSITTLPQTAERLSADFSAYPAFCLSLPAPPREPGEGALRKEKAQNIRFLDASCCLADYALLYRLLFGDSPGFSEWYCDFSGKVRDGKGAACLYMVEGDAVSCAVSPCVGEKTAILSGVTTKETFRSRGFASAAVSALAAQLQVVGMARIYLWCAPSLASFYRALGFTEAGKIMIGTEWKT